MFFTNSLMSDLLNIDNNYGSSYTKNNQVSCYSSKTDTEYTLTLAVPGFKKSDIILNTTAVTHTHSTLHVSTNLTDKRLNECAYLYNFKTKFHIPRGYNADDIKASMQDGILTISIPKSNVLDLNRTITID